MFSKFTKTSVTSYRRGVVKLLLDTNLFTTVWIMSHVMDSHLDQDLKYATF